MLQNPFHAEMFPNFMSTPSLAHLRPFPLTTWEISPHLAVASFQTVVESGKISPDPPFLQPAQIPL